MVKFRLNNQNQIIHFAQYTQSLVGYLNIEQSERCDLNKTVKIMSKVKILMFLNMIFRKKRNKQSNAPSSVLYEKSINQGTTRSKHKYQQNVDALYCFNI